MEDVMKFFLMLAVPLAMILCLPLNLTAKDEILTVPTRADIALTYFHKSSKTGSDKIIVMFPRGGGQGHFEKKDQGFSFSRDFLLRTMESYVKSGLDTAVVGIPSDLELMTDEFRLSDEHYADVLKLLGKLAASGYKSIYLMSSGSGSFSAAALAARPLPEQVKGIVMAASFDVTTIPTPPALDKVKLPVLIIHHQGDMCEGFTFEAAKNIKVALKASKVSLVPVSGGKKEAEWECDNLGPHGLYGAEDQAVKAVLDWIAGKPAPPGISGK